MLNSLSRTIVSLAMLVMFGPAAAQSFYSTHGLGLTNYFVSGKSIGMGGTGLAFFEDMTPNYLNPAALTALSVTTMSGNLVHEATDLTSAADKATETNTDVQGLQFSFPLKADRAAFSMALMPFSSIGYSAQGMGDRDGKTYSEDVSGTGGLNVGVISLAISPFRRLTLGISGLYYFGQLRNRWQVDFTDDNLTDARDEVSRSVRGPNYRLGILARITPRLSVGGVFSPSRSLGTTKRIQLINRLEFRDYVNEDADIPLVFGIGTFFSASRKLQLALDFYTERWSQSNVSELGYVNASKRVGFGLDFASRRLAPQFVSFGFYYRDLGLEVPAQAKVTELFVTFGLGMPIKWALARLDLSLEVGKRGSKTSNPFEEMVVKFTGSVTVGEKWFQGGRR
jgi:hypothetical protein